MLKNVPRAVWGFMVDTFGRPPTVVTHEFARLHERCLSDRWETWTAERGLSGLVLGSATAWPLGLVLHCRLTGRLQFHDVEDRGMHVATALGLTRARQMVTDENHYETTAETITVGMIETHRQWHGSVIFVSRSHRSDRVDLWIGFHDQLAEAAHELDAERARIKAAEEQAKVAKVAARDAQVTRDGQTGRESLGGQVPRNLADLRVHESGSVLHGARSGTADQGFHQGGGTTHSAPSQRARQLITEGVRDVAALSRQLEREGQRVPSTSYLRRLVREARS